MLLAGTDFSRPLPLLGPRRVWAALPAIVVSLLTGRLLDGVVASLYADIFSNHVRTSKDLPSVLAQLQLSKLSQTTKGRLPLAEQVECTLRNVRWVTLYWSTINGCIEAPLDGEHGYIQGATPGLVTFAA